MDAAIISLDSGAATDAAAGPAAAATGPAAADADADVTVLKQCLM